jgi:hypothetical protein
MKQKRAVFAFRIRSKMRKLSISKKSLMRKGLVSFELPMTRWMWLNDILLVFRGWRSSLEGVIRTRKPVAGPCVGARVKVLAGVFSDDGMTRADGIARSLAGEGEVLVVGFSFNGWVGRRAGGAYRVTDLAGGSFPGFHSVLTSALTCLTGGRLVVLTTDLPGLGLALLASYHFDLPVTFIGDGTGEGVGSLDADFGDPEYLDPTSGVWTRLIAGCLKELAESEAERWRRGEAVSLLPAARRFAELFAAFHARTRSPR